MLKFVTFLLMVFVACSPSARKEQPEENRSQVVTDLQGGWERLTRWEDGQWVVFRPCDADNMSMEISGDTLVIGWGQDASFGIIRSVAQSEVPEIYILTVEQDEQQVTYRMRWDDEMYNRAEWWLWEDDESVILVRSELLDDYTLIEQPCHECWEDCEEEVEDIE
ncbi:MAG: hypothetical protein HRU69_05285 [Flammeovirgaceae bacterium]|nr:MAG: hypothetical protein HRU69_05285 [Flammeovirgaceae bacterium]